MTATLVPMQKNLPAPGRNALHRLTLFDGAPMLSAVLFPSTSGAACCCRLMPACG